MTKCNLSASTATQSSRRKFVQMAGASVLAAGVATAPGAAQACTIIVKGCGTIVISRSGSDVVVIVTDSGGAAAVGAKVSVRMGRGAFDEQKTGKLGQTIHPIGVSSGDAVDVVAVIGGCRITKSDCVLT